MPWDEVEEADLATPAGDFRYSALMGNTGEDPQEPYETNLAHAGPCEYRLPLHARGRDINPDDAQDENEPITEHYRLQVWPKHTAQTYAAAHQRQGLDPELGTP
ncbi:hypothetical protein [Streptomyces sp. NPDC001020]